MPSKFGGIIGNAATRSPFSPLLRLSQIDVVDIGPVYSFGRRLMRLAVNDGGFAPLQK